MTSKAARRRRPKRKGMTLPGGEVAPQTTTQGARSTEPADRVAINARMMRVGGIAGHTGLELRVLGALIGPKSSSFGDLAAATRMHEAVVRAACKVLVSKGLAALSVSPMEPALETCAVTQVGRKELSRIKSHAQHPAAGCPVGRVLIRADTLNLWPVVQHIRRTVRAYRASIDAPSPHAQSLGILLPPDHIEATADTPPIDLRSDEDRRRQAVAAWTNLHRWLGYTDNAAASACLRHVADERDEPIRDQDGIIRALRCVGEGMQGQTPKWRGFS